MRYLTQLNAAPTTWLLIAFLGGLTGALLFIVVTSITF